MAASAAAAAAQQQQLLLLLLSVCCCFLLQSPAAAADVPTSSSNGTEDTPESKEQQLQHLFATFAGAAPAAESWLGVRRFPGEAAPLLQQGGPDLWTADQQQQQHEQHQQQQQHGADVSFFAHDIRGRTWGLLVGWVEGSSASLNDFSVHGTKTPQAIEERLLTSWLEELEGLGVTSISAVASLDNTELTRRYLRLGFNPEQIVGIQKEGGPETQFFGALGLACVFTACDCMRVHEGDILLPAARKAAVHEGVSSLVAPLEVLELDEKDVLLAQKAQAFVDRSATHLDPFVLDIIPHSTRTFIVKAKDQKISRLVGLATARVNEYGVMEVPWFYVDSHAEGCASFLLAEALVTSAVQQGVESVLMVLPTASLPAWNAAVAAGFEFQGVKAGGKLVELRFSTDVAASKALCSHFRELKELEYKLATLRARLSDQKSQVHALTTGDEFGSFADPDLRKGRRAGVVPPPVSIFDDLDLFASPEKPSTESGLPLITGIIALYLVVLLVVRHMQKRAWGRRAGSGLHAAGASKNVVDIPSGLLKGQWEWRAAPGKQEDEHSSDLEEFALPLNSESTINFSKSQR
ncbi:hypothetical protein Esti_006340 [Eimeria stiedai]